MELMEMSIVFIGQCGENRRERESPERECERIIGATRHEHSRPSGGGDHPSSAQRGTQGALLRPGGRQRPRVHQGPQHVPDLRQDFNVLEQKKRVTQILQSP
ncbi:hypothetical protein CRUP_001008, partial [Coryphaenoides rupestris]